MNAEVVECPICYETINGVINSIITECGHKFHANCLMKSVAHNGFGCPCCRAKMTEEPTEDSDDDDDSDVNSDDDSDADSESIHSDESQYSESNYTLRGFRLFMSRVENEEQDPEDIEEEYTIVFEGEETEKLPSVEYITEKMLEKGVTMYQLVKCLMLDHEEYEDWDDAGDIFQDISQRIREIITEFPEKVLGATPPANESVIPQADI